MSTVRQRNKEKKRNTHLRVKEVSWNIAPLLSYLRNAEFSPSPNPVSQSGGRIWRLASQFGVFSTCKSRQIQAPCGGGLGSPLAGFSPNTGISLFAYFSTSYLTSGTFSCCYFLLLKQRIFWYYFGRLVMAILWCVSQKAASAYEILCFGMLHFLLRFFMQLTS